MKYFTLIIIACCVITFLQCSPVYAGVSLELSCDGECSWDIGLVAAEATVNTSDTKYTITNTSGGYEDFEIEVETTTGTWSAHTTEEDNDNTTNEFILREDTSTGMLITVTNTALSTDVADSGTYDFGLWFKAPPTGSDEGDATLTVTLTATNFTQVNGTICTASGDCYSGNCIDSYCCDDPCSGNCDRCNVAGTLGVCTDVASDCTGSCQCTGGDCTGPWDWGTTQINGSWDRNCNGSVTKESSTCTGYTTCSTSGTEYSCYVGVMCLTLADYAYEDCSNGGYGTQACGAAWQNKYCYDKACTGIADCIINYYENCRTINRTCRCR